jgi:aspartate/methionine/tyrosine aminotransferase
MAGIRDMHSHRDDSNPQNPTGAILPKSHLDAIVRLARARNITILSDEVYRPLFHGVGPMDPDFPPSMLSVGGDDANVIVTGSLSKAYSLAGLRVGWIASRSAELIERCASTRDYTTISVSLLDQAVAAFALGPDTIHALLGRNVALARANLEMLERWVMKHDEFCEWVKPVAGTTAFVRFFRGEGESRKAVDARVFCERLQERTGVMLLPGDVGFGEEFRGYVRFGYVNRTEIIRQGLEELRKFMREEFDNIPLCE